VSDGAASDASARDRWTAAHVRVLGRLFSVCGAAGATGTPPDAALALTSLAGQLAWHAELLGDLLPTRAGIEVAALVASPVPGVDAAIEHLERAAAAGETDAVCVVVARVVLPRLATSVAAARAATDARLDGPRARALTLVARDLHDAQAVLEPAAERALSVPGALDELARRCVDVERALVAAGVASGLLVDGGDGWRG
jgi:hypothetical protein